eukprot:6370417-Amphidinium_carterae.1
MDMLWLGWSKRVQIECDAQKSSSHPLPSSSYGTDSTSCSSRCDHGGSSLTPNTIATNMITIAIPKD